ncbi:hypothetical protein BDP81DRAFT_393450 [Colletotrichum phormii]|uniref:Fungal N-terminal domain-containing protein n=1 Tax=Colletotrichum phormii TaxID=359342 RepID=A0AAJ0EG58_9PEZI|nr:uncharacterized protein BDP81DRAFT_393450 [Colletotrichum phormii]KAK1637763.1 hypothetical protein BDP81DRAFT_393450 [Colletotrichum phormii]
MDPVTITTSAVTLIEAGIITKSLRDFVHGVRTVDSRIAKLFEELENLTTFLNVVDRELKRCQAFDLAIVEDDLWQQSDIVLMDCMVTRIDLKTLIQDIKNTSSSKGFVWRARAMLDLSIHGNELVSFQEKIHKSNGALQTILHTINVAFAIRSIANQTVILDELEGLKASVDKAFAISDKTAETFTHVKSRQSDARLARNLRDLARAAENFWVTASSTADTSHGGRNARELRDISKRLALAQNVGSLPSSPSEAPSSDNPEVSSPEVSSESSILEDEDVEEEEFEFMVVEDLQKFALEKIEQRQLTDAGTSFEDALTRLEKIISGLKDQGGNGHRRYLSRLRAIKIQLATCYFFQGNWKLAEPLVTDLAASKKDRNGVVCNLLHALALSYLSNFSFEIASETCKQAVKGEMLLRKARNSRDRTRDHHQSLGLMATIQEMAGEHPRAEVFRRKLPAYFKYEHPENFQEFLQTRPDFLSIVFGPNPLDFGYIDTTASLRQRQADLDTHKEVVLGSLDDSSPGDLTSRDHVLTLSEFHGSEVEVSLRRRLTKVFKSAKGHAPKKLKKAAASDDSSQDHSYSSNQPSPLVRGWPKRAADRVLNPMKTKVWWKRRLRGRARTMENAGETLAWSTDDSKV